MINFKLSKIIKYSSIILNEEETLLAMEQFFGENSPYDFEQQEQVTAIFSEWLIFEYKNDKKLRIIDLYYLKNPDNLPENQMEELKKIIETEKYEYLEIEKIKRGEYFTAYGIFTGKKYKIYDKMGSLSIPEIGTLPGRIAQVDKKWYLIGSSSFVLPQTHTKRAKKILLETFNEKISCRQILNYFLPQKKEKTDYSKKEIQNKRKKLVSKYKKIAKKNNCPMEIEKILKSINDEKNNSSPIDWMEKLMSWGVSPKIFEKHIDLFQDLWNFSPHKSINGMSPVEMNMKDTEF